MINRVESGPDIVHIINPHFTMDLPLPNGRVLNESAVIGEIEMIVEMELMNRVEKHD